MSKCSVISHLPSANFLTSELQFLWYLLHSKTFMKRCSFQYSRLSVNVSSPPQVHTAFMQGRQELSTEDRMQTSHHPSVKPRNWHHYSYHPGPCHSYLPNSAWSQTNWYPRNREKTASRPRIGWPAIYKSYSNHSFKGPNQTAPNKSVYIYMQAKHTNSYILPI